MTDPAAFGRPKQARAKATIDALILETAKAMATGGESGVRIQDISQATGVSIGSIYHHFGDRDGLIRATMVHQFAEQIRADVPRVKEFMEGIHSTAELRAEFERMGKFAKNHFANQSALSRAAVLGHTIGRPKLLAELTEVQHELTESTTEVMQLLQDRGILKPNLNPRAAAVLMLGMLFGRAIAELDNDAVTEDEWIRTMLIALGGLFVGTDS
jgi:AcrR family transcriptional regulator